MAKQFLDAIGLSHLWTKIVDTFQEKLVSGTNIKTINGQSLLGNGNISISSEETSGDYLPLSGGIIGDIGSVSTTINPGNIYILEAETGNGVSLSINYITFNQDGETQAEFSASGIKLTGKTNNDLLTANGSTININDLNIPTSYIKSAPSASRNETEVYLENSDNSSCYIYAATSENAGVMTAEDKNNLDALNSDVVSPNFVRATKGDIPLMCVMGTFESILYFVDSPASLSGSTSNITNTNGDYHLCLHIVSTSGVGGVGSSDNNYYETSCSSNTSAFDNIDDFDKYFNKGAFGNASLKNELIYHVTTSFTGHFYFVSTEVFNSTTVAKGFATLAEARAYMKEKYLNAITPITTSELNEILIK